MQRRLMPILTGLGIVLAALSSCMFIVRERDYALVFALGEVRRVISEPGLYFKAPPPFQNVVVLDKRLLSIESQDAERIQTSEKKNLLIDAYVKWRIADPRLYYVTFGTNERATQDRLLAQSVPSRTWCPRNATSSWAKSAPTWRAAPNRWAWKLSMCA